MTFLLKLLPRSLNYYLNKEFKWFRGTKDVRDLSNHLGVLKSLLLQDTFRQGRPTSLASQPLSLACTVQCNYYPTTAAPFMQRTTFARALSAISTFVFFACSLFSVHYLIACLFSFQRSTVFFYNHQDGSIDYC